MNNFWYKFFKIILSPIFRFYYNPKICNKDVINIEGPIIFAGNHKHLYDQCLVIISTKRIIHYLAKKEYFDNNKTRWFFKLVEAIPVDRSKKDGNAKNAALEVLNNNGAIGIFPEGTRNRTNDILLPFKYGAVSLAKKTNATIIPFGITGDYKFRSKNLRITYGEPFKVLDDMSLEDANNQLYKEILNILKNK